MKEKPFDILLADDDKDDCNFFREALNELKLSTYFSVVNDGEQLMLNLLDETIKLPRVLFLDLNMPRKNGFECLDEIKNNKALRDIPVIIFSNAASIPISFFEQEVVNLLYKKGAQHFIRKPPEFSEYKKIIQQTVELMAQGGTSHLSRENFVLTVYNSLVI